MKTGPCPKCDGTVIIQGVRVLDRGSHNFKKDLSLAAYAHPTSWLFKGEVLAPLHACVCASCGYVEFYASNLDELVKAAATAEGGTTKVADVEEGY